MSNFSNPWPVGSPYWYEVERMNQERRKAAIDRIAADLRRNARCKACGCVLLGDEFESGVCVGCQHATAECPVCVRDREFCPLCGGTKRVDICLGSVDDEETNE